MMSDQAPRQSNNVLVMMRDERWVVRVIEDGREYENVFLLEAHASSYADGQRMRLGLFQGLPPVPDLDRHAP